jgi:tryptophan synthase alpha chain
MGGESRLTKAIRAAKAEGRPARIPFLTAGFPGPEAFWEALRGLAENGADIIEVGIPFSDPVADGPVIAEASQEALGMGASLAWALEGLKGAGIATPLVVMSYANPLLRLAWEKSTGAGIPGRVRSSLGLMAQALGDAGVSGAIVPDLPLEESGPFREALSPLGIDLITLVGPNTSDARMREYAPVSTGYVYAVSVLGTTGVRDGLPPEVPETLGRARAAFDIPVALGFGIKEPGQLAALPVQPDAVIFGSALIRHLRAGKDAASFMRPWLGARHPA